MSYRGQEVGRVVDVRMTDTGIEAKLSLDSKVGIPADLDAHVHSRSAIGEQYVDLVPRPDAGAALLKDGDVIPRDRTSVPPDIATILDDTNRGLNAIPRDNLETVLDEGSAAVGGLGSDLARLVTGSTTLAIDARASLDPLTKLIDQSAPILDTQGETANSIASWAANMANLTEQIKQGDADVRGLLTDAPDAAAEARQLFDRLQPSLPIMLANLTGVADVALTYHAGIEQVLVLLPQAIAILDSSLVPDLGLKTAYKGPFVTFDLNLNIPPPCMTGYLPPSQQRSPAYEDYPDRPPATCTAECPKTHRSMSAEHEICLALPSRASARPPRRCVRAMRSMCRSTMATTGRATPTRRCRGRTSLRCVRGHRRRHPRLNQLPRSRPQQRCRTPN